MCPIFINLTKNAGGYHPLYSELGCGGLPRILAARVLPGAVHLHSNASDASHQHRRGSQLVLWPPAQPCRLALRKFRKLSRSKPERLCAHSEEAR